MNKATKAARLTHDALATFRTTHTNLCRANELHGEEVATHEAEANQHTKAAATHRRCRENNAKVIAKLADFVA